MLRSCVDRSRHVPAVEEQARHARVQQAGDDVEKRGLAAAGRARAAHRRRHPRRCGALPSAHSRLGDFGFGAVGVTDVVAVDARHRSLLRPPAFRAAGRWSGRSRRRPSDVRGSMNDLDRPRPARRRWMPCASITQRTSAKSRCTKLSEPVISVTHDLGRQTADAPAPRSREMVRLKADRVTRVGNAGEVGRHREAHPTIKLKARPALAQHDRVERRVGEGLRRDRGRPACGRPRWSGRTAVTRPSDSVAVLPPSSSASCGSVVA